MLGLTLSSKLDLGSHIIYIAKNASKKIGALICSMKFFLIRLLCISINLPCGHVWNSCYGWAGAPGCYLELVDKLQKLICRTVGPSLAGSLEPLSHCLNVAN